MVTTDIAPYDPEWPGDFAAIGAELRVALEPVLGDLLTGLHHIGSTSVEGLAAKPVIDVRVSIRDFRLLFRDYLRAHPEERRRYEDLKRDLAAGEWPSVDGYSDAKGDFVWATLRAADGWSMNDHRPEPFDI